MKPDGSQVTEVTDPLTGAVTKTEVDASGNIRTTVSV
jgi:hypothetical protein